MEGHQKQRGTKSNTKESKVKYGKGDKYVLKPIQKRMEIHPKSIEIPSKSFRLKSVHNASSIQDQSKMHTTTIENPFDIHWNSFPNASQAIQKALKAIPNRKQRRTQ